MESPSLPTSSPVAASRRPFHQSDRSVPPARPVPTDPLPCTPESTAMLEDKPARSPLPARSHGIGASLLYAIDMRRVRSPTAPSELYEEEEGEEKLPVRPRHRDGSAFKDKLKQRESSKRECQLFAHMPMDKVFTRYVTALGRGSTKAVGDAKSALANAYEEQTPSIPEDVEQWGSPRGDRANLSPRPSASSSKHGLVSRPSTASKIASDPVTALPEPRHRAQSMLSAPRSASPQPSSPFPSYHLPTPDRKVPRKPVSPRLYSLEFESPPIPQVQGRRRRPTTSGNPTTINQWAELSLSTPLSAEEVANPAFMPRRASLKQFVVAHQLAHPHTPPGLSQDVAPLVTPVPPDINVTTRPTTLPARPRVRVTSHTLSPEERTRPQRPRLMSEVPRNLGHPHPRDPLLSAYPKSFLDMDHGLPTPPSMPPSLFRQLRNSFTTQRRRETMPLPQAATGIH